MIKSVIIEDEKNTLESTQYLIEKYCKDVSVAGTAQGFKEGHELIQATRPDLIFIDIQLNSLEGTGIDLVQMPEARDCSVIFISGYKDYAVDAFRLKATDYLLKPIKINQLTEAVARAKKQIEERKHAEQAQSNNEVFHIPTHEGVQMIKKADIVHFEADGAYTHVHVANRKEKLTVSVNLGQLESKLNSNFLRVHKSHIINRNHVKGYSRSEGLIVKLTSGTEVPVSRAMKDKFYEWIKGSKN